MHLKHQVLCVDCHVECEAEGLTVGRSQELQSLKCSECSNVLHGSDAREFYSEVIQHYAISLEKREQFRSKGFVHPFPDEISLFQMPFTGRTSRKFYAVYGLMLEN